MIVQNGLVPVGVADLDGNRQRHSAQAVRGGQRAGGHSSDGSYVDLEAVEMLLLFVAAIEFKQDLECGVELRGSQVLAVELVDVARPNFFRPIHEIL